MQISEYQIYKRALCCYCRTCEWYQKTCQTFSQDSLTPFRFLLKKIQSAKMQINAILLCKDFSSLVFLYLIASAAHFMMWASSLAFFLQPKVTFDCFLFHDFHLSMSWSRQLPRQQQPVNQWLRMCMYLWWKLTAIQSHADALQLVQKMDLGQGHVWNGSLLLLGLQPLSKFHQGWNAATNSCALTAAFLVIFALGMLHLGHSSNWIRPLQDWGGNQHHLASSTKLV